MDPNALTNAVGQTLWVSLEIIHKLLIAVESKRRRTPLITKVLNVREACRAETGSQIYTNIKLSDER